MMAEGARAGAQAGGKRHAIPGLLVTDMVVSASSSAAPAISAPTASSEGHLLPLLLGSSALLMPDLDCLWGEGRMLILLCDSGRRGRALPAQPLP